MDYRAMAKEERPMFETAIVAHLEAGDLFLWDSRTIHGNTAGPVHPATRATAKREQPSQAHPGEQLIRCAAYVCMAPKSMVPPQERAELSRLRMEAVKQGWTGGHQARHGLTRFLTR